MKVVRWSCIVIASLLGSCASTSPRFYTLVPESGRDPSAAVAATATENPSWCKMAVIARACTGSSSITTIRPDGGSAGSATRLS